MSVIASGPIRPTLEPMSRPGSLAAVTLLAGLALRPLTAAADHCRVVDVEFTPAPYVPAPGLPDFPSQMVIWLEKPPVFPSTVGEFVDTIYITQETGRFGIGNRPGRMDFNSGPLWPYGRREGVFPIWAHRHLTGPNSPGPYPRVIFHSPPPVDPPPLEDRLSHQPKVSSQELHFCRPLQSTGMDKPFWDAGTCASSSYTDKGLLAADLTSLYPPRADLVRALEDYVDVEMFALINQLDAVSQATPDPGTNSIFTWSIPTELASGDYVLWVEVSKEFDHNATYTEAARPSPAVPYGAYGEAYRGQPSVVFKVPFNIGGAELPEVTLDYAGYSDPDALDGEVRPPDATITTDVLGSGASRLALRLDATNKMFRVRVEPRTEDDHLAPAAPSELTIVDAQAGMSTISFVAPGDDSMVGTARTYEIKYRVGSDMTPDNFEDASSLPLEQDVVPDDAGQVQLVPLKTLLPETDYSVGIRARDNCNNVGPLATLRFTTPERRFGEVDACFIATAAYGTVMAQDVGFLRRFRDSMLRTSVLGELVIESYYTFGPAVAGVIGESDLLRATARGVLEPLVGWVRVFAL